MEEALTAFKHAEFDEIISKHKHICDIIASIEHEKNRISENISKYDPKAVHYANMHLSVIEQNLNEQLGQLKSLVIHLEKNEVIQLEEKNSYLKRRKEEEHFHKVFRLFLPYILICSIYLRTREKVHVE